MRLTKRSSTMWRDESLLFEIKCSVIESKNQEGDMALRKQAAKRTEVRADLVERLAASKIRRVTDEELHEQRISFAFGNAMSNDKITKDSVRTTAQRVRLLD